jgi:hypothetical protein
VLDPFLTAPDSLPPTDLERLSLLWKVWKHLAGVFAAPRLFEKADRNLVDPGEVLQLYEINSPFSRFALGNERLRLVEELRNLILSETGEPTRFLET